MRNSSSLDWLRFMHTPNDYRVSHFSGTGNSKWIANQLSKEQKEESNK